MIYLIQYLGKNCFSQNKNKSYSFIGVKKIPSASLSPPPFKFKFLTCQFNESQETFRIFNAESKED